MKPSNVLNLAVMILFLSSNIFNHALAQDSGGKYKLGLDTALGYTNIKLENPSGAKVLYNGIAVSGRVIVPILDASGFQFALLPGAKYFDLKNTANRDGQKEVANIIGPTVGARITVHHFLVGAEYSRLWGRHFGTGTFSGSTDYSLDTVTYYGGLLFRFNQLSIGATYSSTSSEIDRSYTGLSSNTPFSEQTYWVHAVFTTDWSLTEFFKKLF